MLLNLTDTDVQEAPAPVRDWIAERLGLSCCKPTDTPDEPTFEPEPFIIPTSDELLEKATALLKAKGKGVLQEVLDKVEIKRVKDCPEEKRAELLAEIALRA